MSGLLRRIRGGRAADPDPPPEASVASEGGTEPHAAAPGTGGHVPVPAGVDLDALVGERPTTRRRGRMRRRLRHLRRVREVLLRDLGGLVFEVHRSGASADEVVAAKLQRLSAVDAELRELDSIVGDGRPMVLREPGIGGTCAVCGELYGSEARFCWACGTPLAPGAVRPVVSTWTPALNAAPPAPAEPPTEAHPHPPAEQHAPDPVIEGSSEDMPPEQPTAVLRDEPAQGQPLQPGDPLASPTERRQ